MKKLALIITVSAILIVQTGEAQIKLPAIISSNMVLQRNSKVKLWGWAGENEKITITTSWLSKPVNIKADKEGSWQVVLQTTKEKQSQKIDIRSETSNISLDNILFGEVWVCSGQSNMGQFISGYKGQPTYGANMATAYASNKNLRLFTVKQASSRTPLNDLKEYEPWSEANPENVNTFSAVAYFFGKQLQEILDVPVGIIHSSWGGSNIEAWMSKEVLSKYQDINFDDYKTKSPNHTPIMLFNAMINPLVHYTIKGALWYQGESNARKPMEYKELFPAMVKDWRTRWGIGNFPFYYVQIAPYWYNDNSVFDTYKNSAFQREVQLQCLDIIPNSGIAVTMDIGEEYNIHPPQKKEVADRLLFNSLHGTYGFSKVDCIGPVYDSQEITDDGILLKFKYAENGVYSYGKLEGFLIAGSDKIFYPAEAEIVGRTSVFVKSNKVPNPVAVRYAWQNWVMGTLYDTNLLPASSFRTDNWNVGESSLYSQIEK